MKKSKLLLPALTVSMLGTAIGGGCLVAAAAEPQPHDGGPTVGAFVSWDGYTFNGTSETASENKTTVSYKWDTAGTFLARVNVTGYTSGNLALSLTSQNAATVRLVLFEANGWSVYGADVIATGTELTAGTEYTYSGDLAASLDGVSTFDLGFYFDMNAVTSEKNTVTVNSLTVSGVSYTPTAYTAPLPEVDAPEISFKESSDWTLTNGTVAANTLPKLEGDAAEGAIDNGSAIVTITNPSTIAKTSDDGKTITTLVEIPLSETLEGWPADWSTFYLKLKANNVSEVYGYFQEVDNCNECSEAAQWEGWHAFAFNLWSGGTKSVTEGYRTAAASINGYIKSYLETHAAPPTKIVLGFVAKEGATEASVEIGGMTFGGAEAPTFINDIGEPELTIGDWLTWGQHTIAQEGTLEVEGDKTYTGAKISYTSENLAPGIETSFHAQVVNFDAEKAPTLHIGFYTDSEITLAFGHDWTALTGHETYAKGYHEVEVDYSALTADNFLLRIWTNTNTTNFEGTKTIIIDKILFYKDDVSIALDEAITGGLFNTPKVTDGKLTWTWDAKDAGGYYAVSVPVDGWYSYNRSVLHVNVTLSHDTAFGIWGNANAFLDNVLQNSSHPVLKAGTYDMYLNASSSSFVNGSLNNLMFYCDVNNASEASLTKTVTINSIEFIKATELTSSPNASGITVNYLEQKVTFAETLEVATDKDFANKLTSGATVTPGATLYLRAADGSSAVTATTLSATTLTKDTAPEATIGSSYIRFGAAGYEYKMGEDGEWTTLGSWGNLTANTEYKVYVRVKATETAFASEAVELTVKTAEAAGSDTPDTPDNPGTTTPDDNPGSTTPIPTPTPDDGENKEEEKKGCGSVIGLGAAGLAAMAAVAVGAVVIAKKKKD